MLVLTHSSILYESLFTEHGGWSGWQSWETCSVSCGGGQRSRKRECDNPLPSYGGRDCIGFSEQVDYCNSEPCPSKLDIGIQVNPSRHVLGILVSIGGETPPRMPRTETSNDTQATDISLPVVNGTVKSVVLVNSTATTNTSRSSDVPEASPISFMLFNALFNASTNSAGMSAFLLTVHVFQLLPLLDPAATRCRAKVSEKHVACVAALSYLSQSDFAKSITQ